VQKGLRHKSFASSANNEEEKLPESCTTLPKPLERCKT